MAETERSDYVQYWASLIRGVWRGWWYDPETHRMIMHEFPDIDDTLPMHEQLDQALKKVRFEMVRLYGVDRVLGEATNEAD